MDRKSRRCDVRHPCVQWPLLFFLLVDPAGLCAPGCNTQVGGRPAQDALISDWEKWVKEASGPGYVVEGSKEHFVEFDEPALVIRYKVIRDGRRYCAFTWHPNGNTSVYINNELYSSNISKAPASTGWAVNKYVPANSIGYEEAYYRSLGKDAIRRLLTADGLLDFANRVPLRCDVSKVKDGSVFVDVGWEPEGPKPLDGIFWPTSSVLSLSAGGECKPGGRWLKEWNTVWDSYISTGKLSRHLRVELSDWKDFGSPFGELPSRMVKFTDEIGDEIWLDTCTIESVRPIQAEDRAYLFNSGFGIPERTAKKGIGWPVWFVAGAGVLFLVVLVQNWWRRQPT